MARTGGADSQKVMPIMGHIQELQVRLVLSAIVLIVAGSLAYAFQKPIIDTLLAPLGGASLIYLTPGGGFSFIMLVCIYVGLAASAPVIIHQLYCFVRPALSAKVQKYSLRVFLCSLILLISGVAFGYIVVIPGALDFLYGFAADYINPSLTAESYINFLVAYTLGLGVVFQLPLLLMLIHWIKPLTPSGLLKSERWIIVLAFVAAAIISPTVDPLNQTIIALPVVLIYQLGVVAVLISIRQDRKHKAKLELIATSTTKPKATSLYEPPQSTAPPTYTRPVLDSVTLTPPANAAQPTKRRSLDGFTTGPARRPVPNFASAARQSPLYSPEERTKHYRQTLSLDGISRIA